MIPPPSAGYTSGYARFVPPGLSNDTSVSVNYGDSCVSEENCGLKKGLVAAERNILEMFSALDAEGRRRVFAILAESMREEVLMSLSSECFSQSGEC